MKLLVVEDEPNTGDCLRQGLVEAGCVVDLARDGMAGPIRTLRGMGYALQADAG